jgi:hypothetical protein
MRTIEPRAEATAAETTFQDASRALIKLKILRCKIDGLALIFCRVIFCQPSSFSYCARQRTHSTKMYAALCKGVYNSRWRFALVQIHEAYREF